MAAKRFSTPVLAEGPGGAMNTIAIPFSVEQEWRSKGSVKVRGTLNGQPIRTSLVPAGDGSHHMRIAKDLMAKAKCFVGDTVEVVLEPDGARPRASPKAPTPSPRSARRRD